MRRVGACGGAGAGPHAQTAADLDEDVDADPSHAAEVLKVTSHSQRAPLQAYLR